MFITWGDCKVIIDDWESVWTTIFGEVSCSLFSIFQSKKCSVNFSCKDRKRFLEEVLCRIKNNYWFFFWSIPIKEIKYVPIFHNIELHVTTMSFLKDTNTRRLPSNCQLVSIENISTMMFENFFGLKKNSIIKCKSTFCFKCILFSNSLVLYSIAVTKLCKRYK